EVEAQPHRVDVPGRQRQRQNASPVFSRGMVVASDDGDVEILVPVDMAVQAVALDHRGDAFRSSRVDEVAWRQHHVAREIGDRLGDAPDQHREIALLARLAVDLEPDRRLLLEMTDLGDGRERGAWRGMVEALAEIPRPTGLLR